MPEERKTLFYTYVKYETIPEQKFLRPWIRSTAFLILHSATTAGFVVLGMRLMGMG